MPKILFFDIEATGLHNRSFPIQFGWSTIDLAAESILVRPMPEWDESCIDPKAETIHGISIDFVREHGESPFDVAQKLNEVSANAYVVSDNPYFERMWSDRLFRAVGMERKFGVYGLQTALEQMRPYLDSWCVSRYHQLVEALPESFQHTHKADADAQHMAAMHRMLIDRPFAERLLERAGVKKK